MLEHLSEMFVRGLEMKSTFLEIPVSVGFSHSRQRTLDSIHILFSKPCLQLLAAYKCTWLTVQCCFLLFGARLGSLLKPVSSRFPPTSVSVALHPTHPLPSQSVG